MIPHRINHQPAFLLASSPWRENSLRLEVFSRDYGRVALLARSARARGSDPHAIRPVKHLLVRQRRTQNPAPCRMGGRLAATQKPAPIQRIIRQRNPAQAHRPRRPASQPLPRLGTTYAALRHRTAPSRPVAPFRMAASARIGLRTIRTTRPAAAAHRSPCRLFHATGTHSTTHQRNTKQPALRNGWLHHFRRCLASIGNKQPATPPTPSRISPQPPAHPTLSSRRHRQPPSPASTATNEAETIICNIPLISPKAACTPALPPHNRKHHPNWESNFGWCFSGKLSMHYSHLKLANSSLQESACSSAGSSAMTRKSFK